MSSSAQEKLNQMQGQVATAVEHAKEAAQNVGAKVSDFFQGNPFESPVGRKIELATDATKLATENWGLNMEICDFINSTNEGGRDAIRAIRKRLQTQMGKNNAIIMYTLTVLETCVKNCDQRFKALVCQRDFIGELVKLIGVKYDAPQIVQERMLSLIQSWADAFRNNPALVAVCEIYDELKAKGVEFPATNLDSMAPIITPKQTVFPPKEPGPVANIAEGKPLSSGTPQQPVSYRSPMLATPEQLAKLRSELDIVNGNLTLLRELLGSLAPNREDPEDYSLLQALHSTCRVMHSRVLELIPVITNEEVTYELLFVNDEFNSVFEKYERYMHNRSGAAASSDEPGSSGASKPAGDLIDFSNPAAAEAHHGDVQKQLGSLNVAGHHSNEAYIHDQTEVGLKTAAFNKTEPISEREAKEMSDWLKGTDQTTARKDGPKSEDDGL